MEPDPYGGKARSPEEVRTTWRLAGERSEGYFYGRTCGTGWLGYKQRGNSFARVREGVVVSLQAKAQACVGARCACLVIRYMEESGVLLMVFHGVR